MKIVAYTGLAGSGKDTLANYLVENYGFTKISFAEDLYQEVADAYHVTPAYLNNRPTKETPTPALSLKHCRDPLFVELMLKLEYAALSDEMRNHYFPRVAHAHLNAYEFSRAQESAIRQILLDLPRSPRWTLQKWGTEYRRIHYGDDQYWVRKVDEKFMNLGPDGRAVIADLRFDSEAIFLEGYSAMMLKTVREYSGVIVHASEAGIDPSFLTGEIDNSGELSVSIAQLETYLLPFLAEKPQDVVSHNISGPRY